MALAFNAQYCCACAHEYMHTHAHTINTWSLPTVPVTIIDNSTVGILMIVWNECKTTAIVHKCESHIYTVL